MKIDIIDVDKFVAVNKLEEVTNPIHFSYSKVPTDDGLFSYSIFGRPGSTDRKTVFAYIDLKKPFFNPLVYKNLTVLDRKFIDCIAGSSYFIINNGKLELSDEENKEAGTGIDFLYKNWDKLNFKSTSSNKREERIDMLKTLKKSEIFVTKQIVCPAFYRDIDYQDVNHDDESGKIAVDDINALYAKLIRLCSTMKTEEAIAELDFVGNMTRLSIQKCLIEIYEYFMNLIKGKNGMFRKAVLGKSIDFGGRSVISAPQIKSNSWKDMPSNMEYTGVPLYQCLNLFFPFIVSWIQKFFEREYSFTKTIEGYDTKLKKPFIATISDDAMDDFSYDKIKKQVEIFSKSPSERFEAIKIKTSEGYLPVSFIGSPFDISKYPERKDGIVQRRLTWTDVFFMAAVDVCKDKHVYITRYPLEDYLGIYPSKINVLSTFETQELWINGNFYKFYPKVELDLSKEKIGVKFIDALILFSGMLKALGGRNKNLLI